MNMASVSDAQGFSGYGPDESAYEPLIEGDVKEFFGETLYIEEDKNRWNKAVILSDMITYGYSPSNAASEKFGRAVSLDGRFEWNSSSDGYVRDSDGRWKYIQYERGITDEARAWYHKIYVVKEKRQREADRAILARPIKYAKESEMCPKCHTYCCGDCEAN
jgi:hypothetical protein